MPCCCKFICHGCQYANLLREMTGKLQQKCVFCRCPTQLSKEEQLRYIQKRVEANDPVAMCYMGLVYRNEGDYKKAFGYWTEAVELGDMDAHYNLSLMYSHGEGVEKDDKKELYHLEEAAIGGHVLARHNIGFFEESKRRPFRAIRHYIIAAKMGYDDSLGVLKEFAEEGMVSKEDLTSAIRGHQAAVDATKSPQRETAAAIFSQQRQVV